jgi:light-independent protochlorophyllide reductase subunit N
MFTRPLKRHAQLDPLMDDPLWVAGLMPTR